MTSTMVKCMFCGEIVFGGIVSPNDTLYPHWGKHMNAFVHKSDYNGYAIVKMGVYRVGFMSVSRRFSQLSFVQINNSSEFWSKVKIIFGKDFTSYSLNESFDRPYKNNDRMNDFCKLVNNTNYHCGLCGGIYDCGLPSTEIAAKHAIKCYANLNRPNIK